MATEPELSEEQALLQVVAASDDEAGVLAVDVVQGLDAVGRTVDVAEVEAALERLVERGLLAHDELGVYLLTATGWSALA